MIRQMKGCVAAWSQAFRLPVGLDQDHQDKDALPVCVCGWWSGCDSCWMVVLGTWWLPPPPSPSSPLQEQRPLASCLSLVLTTLTHYTRAHLTQVHQEEEVREAQIVPCWVA